MATGDIRIDSLLALPRNSLATNLPLGRAIEITYSFSGYSTAQVSAVTSMLAEVSTLVGVNFRQVDNGALLVYGYKSDGPTLADGSPGSGSMQLKTDGTGAIAWLNPKVLIALPPPKKVCLTACLGYIQLLITCKCCRAQVIG